MERAPDKNMGNAIAGVALGVSVFVVPAILMGWSDASPLYVVLWAMAWAPLFSWLPDSRAASTAGRVARQIGALIVSTIIACIMLGGLYAAGSFAADWVSQQ